MRDVLASVVLAVLLGGAATSCVTMSKGPADTQRGGDVSAFHACLNAYLTSIAADPVPENGYDVSFVDLNADGVMDAIALMNGRTGWVGSGGATMFVFRGDAAAYQFVSRTTTIRKPIFVRQTRNNGWRDLVVHSSGGGGKSGNRLLVFDGRSYPLSPSVQPETRIISADVMVMTDVEQSGRGYGSPAADSPSPHR